MDGETLPLPLPRESESYEVRWFCAHGCVVHRPEICEVRVGGSLIGTFDPKDRELGPRNVLLVAISKEPRIRFGRLAAAFGVSDETLRLLRRRAEAEGLKSLFGRRGGSAPRMTPQLRRRLERMFSEGVSASEAHRRISKRHDFSLTTVWLVLQDWKAREENRGAMETAKEASSDTSEGVSREAEAEPENATRASPAEAHSRGKGVATSSSDDPIEDLAPAEVRGGTLVQHAGAWLMIAMVARLGLYRHIATLWNSERGSATLRIIVDAVIAALAIGERCVEGLRRLRTPTGALLLRANHVPTASWGRRVLRRFAEACSGAALQMEMARGYVQAARTDEVAVFYVDNHLRPYKGKHVVRRGWRMQDKRAVPGITDYYVHDEDGRPIFRVDAPSHDSLTSWLLPIGRRLRSDLGAGERVLLGFDRAGAYPQQMAELREDGIEFVTYERRPFPLLSPAAFDCTLDLDGEEVGLHESRQTNLGKGRGRVRRIALRMADGEQINLLAVSSEPAHRLVSIITGRWCQENAFKHGAERWGINQLDRRKIEHYDPETVIPNPARRRMDRTLRLARIQDGLARSMLARLPEDDPRHQRAKQDLLEAVTQQTHIEMLRPFTPTHAPLEKTELAGKLVYHEPDYKLVIDAMRIACANAESDFAGELAPHLARPAEAKKVVANVLGAPGKVVVGKANIKVTLQPATTPNEAHALDQMLKAVNRWRLTLPGDPRQRPLRFQLSGESPV